MNATPSALRVGPAPDPADDDRLTVLVADRRPDPALLARLGRLAAHPGVMGVLALPDLHQKENAEVPSSIAVTTRGAIVPAFTSVSVNDGMGLVATDVDARAVDARRAHELFRALNAHAAAHVLDRNRYSLSADGLKRAALEGGRAGAALYGLDPALPSRMEEGGALPVPDGEAAWEHVVPALLRGSRVGRAEMGLNFGGNHFLELQVIDELFEPALAAAWGLARGKLLVMVHLGPGPFGGTLLHHYTRRRSLGAARVPWFFLSKLLLHYGPDGTAPRPPVEVRWRQHFRRNDRDGWSAFAPDSPPGLALRQAIAMATNFGFAYRSATYAAVRDALESTLAPGVRMELVCDVMHNSILEQPGDDGPLWIARHNACRRVPGEPAIVAGRHDVASYLCVGGLPRDPALGSYDHGAGQVIEAWARAGTLAPAGGTTTRVHLRRGRGGGTRSSETLPLRSAEPIARLVGALEQHAIVHPVARLRPLATLKN